MGSTGHINSQFWCLSDNDVGETMRHFLVGVWRLVCCSPASSGGMLTGSWRDTLTGRWHGTGSKLTGDGPGDAVGGESGSHYHRMEVNLGVMGSAHAKHTWDEHFGVMGSTLDLDQNRSCEVH